jgi:molybdopterin adenylyltransferase
MNDTCKVISVNTSEKKGTVKTPRKNIILNQLGVESDAHAGDWHRQVSLLALESIRKFEKKLGRPMDFGEFAENITTQGIVLYETHPGDLLLIGETEMEVTQIGKKCHGDGCQIFQLVGNCIMPKEGIFCKVIKGGVIKPNDHIEYIKRS